MKARTMSSFAGGQNSSPMQALLKGIKRIMAAEYSRELGEKVLYAQCRFSSQVYKQGGSAGYALRRVPVSKEGVIKTALTSGERKSVTTDRVRLMQSSPEEVATVRFIYERYTEARWSDTRIAAHLCSEGGLNHLGRPWDAVTVRRILTSPKYCGELVFNQTTRRLYARSVLNPPNQWVRCEDAIEPMVSKDIYARAQRIRERRSKGGDPESILEQMRVIYRQHGRINEALCRQEKLPGKVSIRKLFGGYIQAYVAAGLPPQLTANGALGIRSVHERIQLGHGGILCEGSHCWRYRPANFCVECASSEWDHDGKSYCGFQTALPRRLAPLARTSALRRKVRFCALRTYERIESGGHPFSPSESNANSKS